MLRQVLVDDYGYALARGRSVQPPKDADYAFKAAPPVLYKRVRHVARHDRDRVVGRMELSCRGHAMPPINVGTVKALDDISQPHPSQDRLRARASDARRSRGAHLRCASRSA